MKPRVMVLCDRLDIAGGVERFACELANDLAAAGHDTVLGSVATRREQVHYALAPAVRVAQGDAPLPAGDGATAVLRRQWRTGRTLARLIARERPAAVVLNGLTTACSTLVFARRWAPRTIVCDHNHFFARSRPWQRLRAALYPRLGAVVSLTEADAPRFRALNPRTVVIPNAASLRAETPANTAEPRVLAVGRHVAQKGLDLLLDAWRTVQAARPDAVLRIVGNGPLEAALKQQAAGLQVEWVAPTADMAAQYRAAQVFVLPSRYEGMPLVLLEAQAMGLPAVAFDCPTGPADIVTPDTGVLVPAGDTAALAQALLRVLADAPLRSSMGAAALQRSRRVFSPERHRAAWRALVDEVARG